MEKRAFAPKDIYSIRNAGAARLSPCGEKLAYVVRKIDEEEDKALNYIFLAEVKSGRVIKLTSSGKDGSPVFSPDGRRLAFISSRSGKSQIWIIDIDQSGEAWHIPTKETVSGPLVWLPDGKDLLYMSSTFSHEDEWVPYPGAPDYDKERLEKMAREANKDKKDKEKDKKANKVKVVTRFMYRFNNVGYFGDIRRQVFVTPVPEEAPWEKLEPQGRQITQGDYDHSAPTISPNGKYMVLSARRSCTSDYDNREDLWLFEVENSNAHLLYEAPGHTGNPLWSPDGQFIAFTGSDRSEGESTTTGLWLLPVADVLSNLKEKGLFEPLHLKQATAITKPLDRPVGAYGGSDLRLYGGSMMAWQGRELFFLMSDRGVGGIYKATPEGRVEDIEVDAKRSFTSLHVQNGVMVYTASDPLTVEELYVNNGEEKLVSDLNTKFMQGIRLGDWERFTYESDDAQEVDGWVIYPTDFDRRKKYPLLLLVHGGPHGAYGSSFMSKAQMFAANGYIVMYTNPRGSETYGQQFASCIDKNWGDRDYADIMAGVDALIAQGNVDDTNMFMHGWSYGGYMACWIATQTDRFKAICAGASVTNMLTGYGTSDIPAADEWEYGGLPWKDAAHLLWHSPINHVEYVTTPMMLMHGEDDYRVHVAQTEEFYRALKRLGKEAVMIRYPGEFHGLSRPVHRVDYSQRLLSWFEYYRNR